MSEKNTVEWRTEIRDELLDVASSPKYDGASYPMVQQLDPDGTGQDTLRAFLEVAFEEIVDQLAGNHQIYADVERYGAETPDYEAVSDVLDEDNIEDINVLNGGWASPTVRVWLKDCPVWANTATRQEFKFSVSREHYNGNYAHAILDVRPQ